jgi:hypothetical protein
MLECTRPARKLNGLRAVVHGLVRHSSALLVATCALEKIADMTTGQIEKRFPRYALAYIRFLAGERDTIPTPTPPADLRRHHAR